jgi:hypothetical protein
MSIEDGDEEFAETDLFAAELEEEDLSPIDGFDDDEDF